MCIIFPLDTQTHLPFRKFSTSSEVPQNPNDLSIDYIIRADDPSERLNLGVTVYKFSSFLYFYTDFYGQVF